MNRTTLLTVDAIINLVLGALLVFFPDRLVAFLGVPPSTSGFYPNVLGGVLFGIGIALIIERNNRTQAGLGLGLHGAVAINLCGGLALGAWLVFGRLDLPARGLIFLWSLCAVLVGISAAEILSGIKKRSDV